MHTCERWMTAQSHTMSLKGKIIFIAQKSDAQQF